MKYKTIVIDYPWSVNSNFNKYGYGDFPYKQMSDDEILNFNLDDFADDNCDLFIWTTHSKLPLCFDILNKYNFKYHCLVTWDKLSGICINGFYRNTELIVYGYRGKMGIKLEGNYIPTLITEKAKGHSKKPDKFYKILRERTLSPRIDIFNRRTILGFDSFGDELPKERQLFILNE